MKAAATISDDELDHYRNWVGRRWERADEVANEVIQRFAATMDQPVPTDGTVPEMWHYGLFLDLSKTKDLGDDGHPPRGEEMPPVRLPRRMFAGSAIEFISPLRIATHAVCTSEIASIDRRRGKSGDLVFVGVDRVVRQNDKICVKEHQTIVYLGSGNKIAAVVPDPGATEGAGPRNEIWTPRSVELLRFSAVTFNAHRIHYDKDYTTEVEGYPDIVVHGPLIALRLCGFVRRRFGRPLSQFTFRGEAPSFLGLPIRFAFDGDSETADVFAIRCDRKVVMRGQAR